MKNKKKILTLCMFVFLVFLLTACETEGKKLKGENNEEFQSKAEDQGNHVTEDVADEGVVEANDVMGDDVENDDVLGSVEDLNPEIIKISPEVKDVDVRYTEGMGVFEYKNKYGYMGIDGRVIIEPKYTHVSDFSNGYAVVKYDSEGKRNRVNPGDYIAIINTDGEEIFKKENGDFIKLEFGQGFNNGVALIMERIDSGELILGDPIYNDFIVAIDTEGKELGRMNAKMKITNEIDDIDIHFSLKGFANGDTVVWFKNNFPGGNLLLTDIKGDKKGLIMDDFGGDYIYYSDGYIGSDSDISDLEGNLILKNEYERLGKISEGIIPFYKYNAWGFMDTSENILIEQEYDKVAKFTNGIVDVVKSGKHLYINKNNEIVEDGQILFNDPGRNGLAYVEDLNSNKQIVNYDGEVVYALQKGERFMHIENNKIYIFVE